MQLLLQGAVARDAEDRVSVQTLEERIGPGLRNRALVQRAAEIALKRRTVKRNAERTEYIVPAHLLKRLKIQRALLETLPETVVFPCEHIVHIRCVGGQTEMGESLRHRLLHIAVKAQKRIVNVYEDCLVSHGVPHIMHARSSAARGRESR